MLFRSPLSLGGLAVVLWFGLGCETTERILIPAEPIHERGVHVADPALAGKWLLEEGRLLPTLEAALVATALEVEPDGHATVWFEDLRTDTRDCARAFCLYDGETMVIDFSREIHANFLPERSEFFPVVVRENDRLGVADESGQVALFTRQSELPADVVCAPLPFAFSYPIQETPWVWSDLVFFDGDFFFGTTDAEVHRFDPGTGTLQAPFATGVTHRHIQAVQSPNGATPNFWAHCGCGGSPEIIRTNLTNDFQIIHLGDDLGHDFTVRSAVHVPGGSLWIAGTNQQSGYDEILRVNPNTVPPTLDEVLWFPRTLRGLTWDGTHLWGYVTIIGRTIAKIDPSTGRTVASYAVPDPAIDWTGLEFDPDGNLWALGTDPDSRMGILMKTGNVAGVP